MSPAHMILHGYFIKESLFQRSTESKPTWSKAWSLQPETKITLTPLFDQLMFWSMNNSLFHRDPQFNRVTSNIALACSQMHHFHSLEMVGEGPKLLRNGGSNTYHLSCIQHLQLLYLPIPRVNPNQTLLSSSEKRRTTNHLPTFAGQM